MYPDYIPFEIGIPLALLLWAVVGYLLYRDHRLRKIEKARAEQAGVYIQMGGEWVLVPSDRRINPNPQKIYDQEEDK